MAGERKWKWRESSPSSGRSGGRSLPRAVAQSLPAGLPGQVAMLRLADEIGGEILIDGISHASVSHEELRTKLAIIPQVRCRCASFAGARASDFGDYSTDPV